MNQPSTHSLLEALQRLSTEIRELDVGSTIDRLAWPVDELTFYRDYVARNKPCILTGAVQDWAALQAWDEAGLLRRAGDAIVTIDFTPNGRGDAVTVLPAPAAAAAAAAPCCEDAAQPGPTAAGCQQPASSQQPLPGPAGARSAEEQQKQLCFCTPEERRMPFSEFVRAFRASQQPGAGITDIPYLQHQNSNLSEELPGLQRDVGGQLLEWAQRVFGAAPDASNLWIGDERAATSFHKDHYQNLYAVIAGTKVFHLLPYADCYRMALRAYPAATYARGVSGGLEPRLQRPRREVMWSPVDPEPADPAAAAAAAPLFHHPTLPPPLVACVGPGETLYLPAMWLHWVAQEPGRERWVVAVNYWFDMPYDALYALNGFVEQVAAQSGLLQPPGQEGGGCA